jgi:phosphoglycolate phosphatase
VTPAKQIAVIDHHQISGALPELHEVRSNMGSCSTIVWDMLRGEGYEVNRNRKLATALYYGLYSDTSGFTEINHPLDRDLQDSLVYDRNLVTRMHNSNLSLGEMKIAGLAMLGCEYYEENRYAILNTDPCDPNILGLISDFFLEVDTVDICLVYNILPFGIKFSVRSCEKTVRASELGQFLADGIGSGGGHKDKAGGLIKTDLLAEKYERYASAAESHKNYVVEEIMRERMEAYFASFDVIYAGECEPHPADMQIYHKLPLPVGFVRVTDLFRRGDPATVRTLEEDLEITIEDNIYLMIGIRGEVYPIMRDKFGRSYKPTREKYQPVLEYEPTVRDGVTGEMKRLLPYAGACIPGEDVRIYARKLNRCMKVFTEWDEDRYMTGYPGDYLAVRSDDCHDVYIIKKEIFKKCYVKE